MCCNHLKKFGVKIQSLHKQVTGSCHLCVANFPNGKTETFLIDCGLVQEKSFYSLNCENFHFNAQEYLYFLIPLQY